MQMTEIASPAEAVAEPVIVLVFGLPGSGKSYFAERLSARIGASLVSSDRIRRDLEMLGRYNQKSKAVIYKRMLALMEDKIKAGRSVVLDATFSKEKWRNAFRKRALQLHKMIHFIAINAAEEVIRQRLSRPRKYSEADFKVYLRVKNGFETMHDYHLTLQSDRSTVAEMLAQALVYIGLYHEKN